MPVIQWFPGHMAKARRVLQENAPLVDVILEIVDARCPLASSNADMMKLVAHKAQIKILNKADLADPGATRAWVEYFKRQGHLAVPLDAVKGTGARDVVAAIGQAFAPKLAEWTAKGRKPRPARAMAVGIPNVGKSSAINRLVGARKAVVGDKPGVTRGKQWVRIGGDVELLDMPGILVPKFEDPWDGVLLAAMGSVKDDVYDTFDVVAKLLPVLWEKSRENLEQRMGLSELSDDPVENLQAIGRYRGLLRAGGEVEIDKVALMILREFREGRLGRMTLQVTPSV
ncbi:MAG TPA: ribosome biogenesis GTPase YlqF [Symbiobacteriaceae bacterium]|nr:ribosome biogenesis GTPase YlqF [Symbiobacteriaceae bacterium]